MVYYLPDGGTSDGDSASDAPTETPANPEKLADLRVFWGPEICRLEYLVHLLDTGRIKDEYRPPVHR